MKTVLIFFTDLVGAICLIPFLFICTCSLVAAVGAIAAPCFMVAAVLSIVLIYA